MATGYELSCGLPKDSSLQRFESSRKPSNLGLKALDLILKVGSFGSS